MIVLAIFVAAVIVTVVLLLRARKRPEPEVRPTWDVDSVYPTDWQQGTTVAVAVPGKPGVFVAPLSTSVFTPAVDEDRTYNSIDSSDLALASLAVAMSTADYASSSPDTSPSCESSSFDSGSSSSSYDSGSSCSDTSSSFDGGSSGGGGSDGSWS